MNDAGAFSREAMWGPPGGTEQGSDHIDQSEPFPRDDASRGGGIRTHDLFVPNHDTSAFD
jgi:hypothetical protein